MASTEPNKAIINSPLTPAEFMSRLADSMGEPMTLLEGFSGGKRTGHFYGDISDNSFKIARQHFRSRFGQAAWFIGTVTEHDEGCRIEIEVERQGYAETLRAIGIGIQWLFGIGAIALGFQFAVDHAGEFFALNLRAFVGWAVVAIGMLLVAGFGLLFGWIWKSFPYNIHRRLGLKELSRIANPNRRLLDRIIPRHCSPR